MRLRTMMLFCLLPLVGGAQVSPSFQLTGTAINTTDPENPVAAPVQISVSPGVCKLIVSAPLNGSGPCTIKLYDPKTGKIELVSLGPPTIAWTGGVKGNFASGTYKINVGSQTGYFYLAILKAEPDSLLPPSTDIPIAPHRGSCSPAIESMMSGEIEGWSGETIFKLDNGQIWQQAEYDYNYFYAFRPDVTIYETSAGCRMKVEDEEETILVKRIK